MRQFYCIDDVCTHDGGPLAEGDLEGHTIACPRHGAKFDIRDGRALTMPATSRSAMISTKLVGSPFKNAIWLIRRTPWL